jgi:signal transduction histidine kinase
MVGMKYRFSFRTQMLLVFLLCLGLLGVGMVFVNTYLIAGLKERMREQAILLAEEQGRQAAGRILEMLDTEGTGDLLKSRDTPAMRHQVEIVLQGNNNVMAVCVLDSEGNVVLTDTGAKPELLDLVKDEKGVEASFDLGDFNSIRVRLKEHHPSLREVKVPIVKDNIVMGNMLFLVSESNIYKDIQSAAMEIRRRLYSVLMAFIGVLSLGLYLTGRLFRRQMRLRADNERLDRMAYVGTLAAGLAHEIRNPLNAMSVNLAVAREELEAGEQGSSEIARRALELIQRETGRLDQSMTSFMQFARPDANRHDSVELRLVLREVLELLRPQIEDYGIELAMDLPEETRLRGDFSGLRQVLYNVALNAIQAMGAQAREGRPRRLVIGGRRESAQWFIWIEDSGPGIPVGHEEKIFEVFHSTKAAGSGFGLAIARAIMESHEGGIVARRVEGGGTRIEITLPETSRRKTMAVFGQGS